MNRMTTARIFRAMCAFAFAVVVSVGAQDGDGEGGYDSPYFQADFTQDLNSWTSALVNPALLFRVNQMHASMAFYRWGLDRGNMGYQDFSLFYPYRYRHTIGLTVLHARNSMEKVTADNVDLDIDGGTVSYQDLWLIGNYGVKVLPWLWLGGNLKMRTQTQFGTSAISKVPGLDIGVYLNPIDDARWGDFGISLTAQDILPTQTPWNADEFTIVKSSDLTTVSRGRVGLRWAGLNDNLVLSGEIIVDNAFRDLIDNFPWAQLKEQLAGGNVTVNDIKDLSKEFPMAVRWGFHAKYQFIPQIWFKGGWTNNNIPYLGFSYNLLYPLPEMINYFNIDYHFGYSFLEDAANMDDERGLVMMIRASTDFGRTREQKESKRMYDKLVVAPMDTYQEAMRLYYAGKYWEASFAYGKLLSMFPTFYLNDKAVYYMGDCYKKMYMNNTSREVFREALDEYSTSDMRAFYLYGIMSLDYREDNEFEAMRNYAFIVNLYPDSEIRGEAEYLAGEIEFAKGNYDAAREHFEAVKPENESYLYAQYTLSILNFESDRHQAAVQNLRLILDDTTTKAHDRRLQDAAAVKLGQVYFEMGDKYREAVEAFGLVNPSAKPHGDEAILGTIWTWVKAGQPQQAQSHIDRLFQIHPESPFIPEGYLLRGYTYMLQRNYAAAVPEFEKAIAAAESNKFLTEDSVKVRKVKNDGAAEEFAPTADRIKKNAMRKPTPRTVEERGELYKGYEVFDKENRDFFHYKLTAKSHKNFFMQKEQIIDDASFALAKSTSAAARASGGARMDGLRQQGQQLEDEIQRLQRELEEGSGAEPEPDDAGFDE